MENTNDNTIDLRRFFELMREHVVALVLWSLGLALVGWAVANFAITPKYTSTAQILVSPKNSNSNNPDQIYTTQQANMQLVTTYKDIVTSHVVLKEASEYLANPYTVVKPAVKAKYKVTDGKRVRVVRKAQPAVIKRDPHSYNVSASELAGCVGVSTQQQSQVFAITATTPFPAKSKAIANAVAKVFSKRIKTIMNINNVTIVSPAVDGQYSSPNIKLFTLAGLVIGFVLSFGVILLCEAMSTKIRDDSYLSDDLDLTDLGQIAHIKMPADFNIESALRGKSEVKSTNINGRTTRRRRV
ncbi:YveK family protein [Lactobacillus helveticus]|uniref:YveK family protein n=1 Tax=Lactobacillus helveticus TaxID=1587 RepID=UPI00156632EF|nr:Wzz/FepE/Etk N-terminal domain-containing protein [Lactobacillus helveticus]NRO45068.1 Capsular polysaccharide type 8 biosynthesis protein cap8A [Lactobacillus helveticus]